MTKSFKGRTDRLLTCSEEVAGIVIKSAGHIEGGLPKLCEDYRFLCGRFLEEEVFFRRNDRYSHSTFATANEQVYANKPFMDRYLNWILMSHVLIFNHAAAIDSFRYDFMKLTKPGTRHLEVGPGHGLLLYFASKEQSLASITGWDVSETSINQCKRNLQLMGLAQPVELRLQDVVAAPAPASDSEHFHSIVISEVLEHLEDPHTLLRKLSDHLAPGGHIWVNVPINSPAPDHIYLLRTIDDARAMVRNAGLTIVDERHFPMSGATLEKAQKLKLTINSTFSARR